MEKHLRWRSGGEIALFSKTSLFFCLGFILWLSWATGAHAQAPSFEKVMETYNGANKAANFEYALALENLHTLYFRKLDEQSAGFQKAGKLDEMLVIRGEKKRVEKMSALIDEVEFNAAPESVTKLHEAARKRAVELRKSFLDQKWEANQAAQKTLRELVKTSTQKGNITEAVSYKNTLVEIAGESEPLKAGLDALGFKVPGEGEDEKPAGPKLNGADVARHAILYYNFERTVGEQIPDLSGKANHGKFLGVEFDKGHTGRAAKFRDPGCFVELPMRTFLRAKPMSISMWVYGAADGGFEKKYGRLFNKGDSLNDYYALILTSGDGDGHPIAGFVPKGSKGGRGVVNIRSTVALKNGTWQHLVLTFDGRSAIRLYVNGKDVTAPYENVPWTVYGPPHAFFGARQITDNGHDARPWKGRIDEVLIFNGVIGQAQAAALKSWR